MSRREPYKTAEAAGDAPPIWRSLEEKNQSASERKETAESEFPDGVVGLSSLVSRRRFMAWSGAGAAATSLGACIRRPEEKILPYTKSREHTVPGVPLHFATAVEHRGEPVGLVVTSHEGRPTKVEGNPAHPNSLGATDMQLQASVMDLYDPDRARGPSKRATSGDSAREKKEYKDFEKALASIVAKAQADKGRSLRFLTPPSCSPTWLRLRDEVLKRFPLARFAQYASVHESNAQEGARLAFGAPLEARVDLSKATRVVAVDSDFLGVEMGSIRATKGFSAGRKLDSAKSDMNRLYVVEPSLSVTGMNADHRLRLPARSAGHYLAGLFCSVLERQARSTELPPEFRSLARECSRATTADIPSAWFEAVADDLVRAKGKAVVLVGPKQPPSVHALAHAVNRLLGAEKRVVALRPPVDPDAGPQLVDLQLLTKELQDGLVSTLVLLGGNPVYDAPADAKFDTVLRKPGLTSIHLSSHLNETAELCTWHVPETHAFEAWGDHLASDGTYSVQQPLIHPLWVAKSQIEMLGIFAGKKAPSARDLVEDTFLDLTASWKPWGKSLWRKTLKEGVMSLPERRQSLLASLEAKMKAKGAATPASSQTVDDPAASLDAGDSEGEDGKKLSESERLERQKARVAAMPAFEVQIPEVQHADIAGAIGSQLQSKKAELGSGNLEAVFVPDNKILNGSYANNLWLLELPDPVTKVSWDNTAQMSPTTARALGVSSGELIEVTIAKAGTAKVAAQVVPGVADWVLVLPLGWGRKAAGLYAKGSGFDVQTLRTSASFYFGDGATVKRTGANYTLAQAQTHHSMEGRPLAIDATLAEYKKTPDFASRKTIEMSPPPLWKQVDYSDGHKWGMSIDLTSCTGCNACVIACQSENNTPVGGKREVERQRTMYWMRIDRYFVGEEDDPEVALQPVACQHCEEAPCENVCPVNATVHSPEGTNDMAYNRCIGTRYCMNNCPYKVRRFNYLSWHDRDPHGEVPETRKMQFNPNVTVRMRGVMEKCSYCIQRIQEAKYKAKREHRSVREGDIVTACQQVCPADAIVFGDLNDKKSKVAALAKTDRGYKLLAEIGTQPRTTFLGKIRNPNPSIKRAVAAGKGSEA